MKKGVELYDEGVRGIIRHEGTWNLKTKGVTWNYKTRGDTEL